MSIFIKAMVKYKCFRALNKDDILQPCISPLNFRSPNGGDGGNEVGYKI